MTRPVVRLLAFSLLTIIAAVPASAQSLADVARTSNTGRTAAPKPSKVYTNDNLRQDITPSPAPSPDGSTPADAAPAAAAAAEPAADPAAPESGARDEKYWRERMRAAREALERNESFVSALQTQINSLTTDFVNRDDPAQRSAIEQRRTKAVADLEKVQRDIEASKKGIAAVEDEARKAGVPAGWLR